jgi:Na+(H+)/acetate symporter ActP
VKAVLIGQILIRKGRIWTEKPRIDHVVIFQASAPRIFNAAALIGLVTAGDLAAAIVSAAAAGLAEVTASAVEDSVAAALADSAAADSGADGKN